MPANLRFVTALLFVLACAGPVDAFVAPRSSIPREQQVQAVAELARRLLPNHHHRFRFEWLEPEGVHDVFELDRDDETIIVRGSSGVSLTTGLNWYLKHTAGCHVSWTGDQLNLPDPLPAPTATRIVQPYRVVSHFNFCTFSYSTPWWNWPRWEREIDWMALNGINAPLMVVGHEAILYRLFTRHGLTDEQVRDFLVGPAYFAWQFMGKIESHAGPLPIRWIEQRVQLGQQILGRMRELGMTPVQPAFGGVVPGALVSQNPDLRHLQKRPWCGFPGTWQLHGLDPSFAKLADDFLRIQHDLFGSDGLYAADPFMESVPPEDDPDFLPELGAAIFSGITRHDPEGILVLQSWSLQARRKPMVDRLAPGRTLIFDLTGFATVSANDDRRTADDRPLWGLPTVYGVLHNYGGRSYLGGQILPALANGIFVSRFGDGQRGGWANIVGLGAFPEASDQNPVIYDLLYDHVGRTERVNVPKWIEAYADRRYGRPLPAARQAWQTLLRTAYSHSRQDSMICARPALDVRRSSPNGPLNDPGRDPMPPYKPMDLVSAWEALISIAGEVGHVDPYGYDLVDVGRQVMADLAIPIQIRMSAAYLAEDLDTFRSYARELLALIEDMDRLVGTRREFLLGRWLHEARSWGTSPEERDLYEFNARLLLTSWGPADRPVIFDYAHREWNGLLSGYYLMRWKRFIDYLETQSAAGVRVDETKMPRWYARPAQTANSFYTDLFAAEQAFTRDTTVYPHEPVGDPVEVSRQMLDKYRPIIMREYVEKPPIPRDAARRTAETGS